MTRKRFIKLLMGSRAFDRNQANDVAKFYMAHPKVYPHSYEAMCEILLFR